MSAIVHRDIAVFLNLCSQSDIGITWSTASTKIAVIRSRQCAGEEDLDLKCTGLSTLQQNDAAENLGGATLVEGGLIPETCKLITCRR